VDRLRAANWVSRCWADGEAREERMSVDARSDRSARERSPPTRRRI